MDDIREQLSTEEKRITLMERIMKQNDLDGNGFISREEFYKGKDPAKMKASKKDEL